MAHPSRVTEAAADTAPLVNPNAPLVNPNAPLANPNAPLANPDAIDAALARLRPTSSDLSIPHRPMPTDSSLARHITVNAPDASLSRHQMSQHPSLAHHLTPSHPSLARQPMPPHPALSRHPTPPHPHPALARHLTVDGDVGLSDEDARRLARGYFWGGCLLLPWLWFVNCYLFWPVLRHNAGRDPVLRAYVVSSAVGFAVAASLLTTWALTFSLFGEALLGADTWRKMLVYNAADDLLRWLNSIG